MSGFADSPAWKTFFSNRERICAGCEFPWDIDEPGAHLIIANSPGRYAGLLHGRDSTRKPAPDVWSPAAYTWHIADVVRVWAERFWAHAYDASAPIVPFDQDALAEARGYEQSSSVAAVWALDRAVADWVTAIENVDAGRPFLHPEDGEMSVGDVVRWVAHEVHHHDLDVRRGLA
jgi:DinB family protein